VNLGSVESILCLARSYWEFKNEKAKELVRLFANEPDLMDDVVEAILNEM
jgi:hypothetical protein